ncbi:HAD-IA family hydrolase [Litoricolaceae bacterium]|jgi:HAD superfamily hydrolase (TIGR01509 family)|nr:HAD-IA family hydrolase [Litorivicinaceae bacterium]MDC1076315.1 HAD-IA family hydrolase [Litorivicinus sp.]NBR75542.1 HAD family hydrolase [Gammaproteobacteria bacterium]
MMLKAVIFDVDGTLAETEEVHREAFNVVFEQSGLGWYWSPELYRELLKVTGGKERIRHFTRSEGITGISDEDIASLHRLKTTQYAELLPQSVELRPGVERLIDECLSRSIRLAIATTTTEANVEALDQAVGGALKLSQFEAIVGGVTVPEKKPSPQVYEVALAKLGLKPEEAIAIEDARAGVLAARGAGLRCLASPSFYTVEHDLSKATAIVDRLSDRGDGKPVTVDYLDLLSD